jgi:hypothetical protein
LASRSPDEVYAGKRGEIGGVIKPRANLGQAAILSQNRNHLKFSSRWEANIGFQFNQLLTKQPTGMRSSIKEFGPKHASDKPFRATPPTRHEKSLSTRRLSHFASKFGIRVSTKVDHA